jgi:dihydrofolate synthase/folylpolyglutamate synthase
MNYQRTLQYMFDKLPMFTRVGMAAYKANLDNTIALNQKLDNPHLKFKSIHIAGTNGKGSCSHMLAAIFQAAGYKTGLYTSPHIRDFRERIRINGEMISEQRVVDFIAGNQEIIEQLKPSFFEITVAMAFDYFALEKVDIAIIEVGLGGLLDSTNIITPEVSVITNISFDHTSLLGQSLQEIATQKAGIIKEHVPVVIGESQSNLRNLFFAQAIKHKSQLYYADAIYETTFSEQKGNRLHVKMLDKSHLVLHDLEVELAGTYQTKNVKTVLTACDLMKHKGWEIREEHIKQGLREVKLRTGLRGRFEIIHESPTIVLDVSHNEAGLKEVFAQVKQMKYENLYFILGFAKDKDLHNVVNLFPQDAHYIATQAQIPRALPYEELNAMLQERDLDSEPAESVSKAIQEVLPKLTKSDLLIITGSFFTLDEAYAFFESSAS